MPISTQTKNFTMTSITLTDGTGSPLTHTIVGHNNDLSIDNIGGEKLNAITQYDSSGRFDSVAYAGRIYPVVSFSFKLKQFTHASAANTLDFLKRRGFYSSAISTLGGTAGQKVWAFHVTFGVEGTAFGDDNDHSLMLRDCIVQSVGVAEGDPDSISVSLMCTGEVWINGVSATAQISY